MRRDLLLAAAVVAGVAFASPAAAQEVDLAAREADLFGENPSETQAREDDLFGGSSDADVPPTNAATIDELAPVDSAMLLSKLAATNDKLAIGGRLFAQYSYQALEKGDWGDFRLSSPNLLDVYLDARPNDRVRAYARGRLIFNPTAGVSVQGVTQPQLATQLDQLWVKFDAARRVYFTLGRQRIKWGASRFWNPTDFLNQTVLDPLAPIDVRLGTTLFKVHVPVNLEVSRADGTNVAMNFYGIVDLQDASTAGEVGGSLRAEIAAGPAEFALTAALKKGQPWRFGLDVSTGIGLVDARAEAAMLYADAAGVLRRYQGTLDLEVMPPEFPTTTDLKGRWIPQLVVGFDTQLMYSDEDSVLFGAEYFFNDLGYADAGLLPMLLFGSQVTGDRPVRGTSFQPLYNGRHYAGAFVMLMAPGSWNDTTFSLSSINALGGLFEKGGTGLKGLNGVARLDVRQTVLTNLSLNAWVSAYYGDTGEFRFRFKLDPVPFVDELKNGIGIPANAFEAGVGLTLSL